VAEIFLSLSCGKIGRDLWEIVSLRVHKKERERERERKGKVGGLDLLLLRKLWIIPTASARSRGASLCENKILRLKTDNRTALLLLMHIFILKIQ